MIDVPANIGAKASRLRPFQDLQVIGNNLIRSIEWLNGWPRHYDGRAIDRGCRERF